MSISNAVTTPGHSFLGARDEREILEKKKSPGCPSWAVFGHQYLFTDIYFSSSQAPDSLIQGCLSGQLQGDCFPDQVHKTLVPKPDAELTNL